MATGSWTDAENDLIVGDYFAMLAADLTGLSYNKAEHNRRIRDQIGRNRGSIEYKHQNISAALLGLGETWIPGYKPAFNVQASLRYAVARWLHRNPEFQETVLGRIKTDGYKQAAELVIDPPPALKNTPPPNEIKQIFEIARRFDAAGRAERNRALGRAGEERVLRHEKAVLVQAGRSDLAKSVRWVSEEDGDGAGYDIQSFSPEGRIRLIEVKTTTGWERTPFYITRNELTVAESRPAEWRMLRLWNFARKPRAFELHPPLDAHVTLMATSYEACFR